MNTKQAQADKTHSQAVNPSPDGQRWSCSGQEEGESSLEQNCTSAHPTQRCARGRDAAAPQGEPHQCKTLIPDELHSGEAGKFCVCS